MECSITNTALFRSGFRPFFLLGGVFGLLAVAYFILLMSGAVEFFPSTWDVIAWHRHEMLFGYAGAIVAGFLLTAVPNWTGQSTPTGLGLALLVALWVAGRLALLTSAYFPASLVAIVDVMFFLVCAAGILPALMRSKNSRNYFFVVLLTLLALANGMTHFGNADTGILLGLGIITLMMVVIGGRVIPFFTEKPLGLSIRRDARLDRIVILSTIAPLALEIFGVTGALTGWLFVLAVLAHGWRLSQWQSMKTLGTPLLWILHVGYAWLVIGFFLKAGYHLGLPIPSTLATHALTAGGIGSLTLGMMARVSLGHSGRPLEVGGPMMIAFICITLAAIFRVFGVLFFPDLAQRWWEAASLFWMLGLSIFVVVYIPVLTRPRLDGRDG